MPDRRTVAMEALERRPALAEEGSLLRAVYLGHFDRSIGGGSPQRQIE